MLKGEEIIKNLMLQNMRLQGRIKSQNLELRKLKYEPAKKSSSCPNLAELNKSYSVNQSKMTDFYPKISMNIQRTSTSVPTIVRTPVPTTTVSKNIDLSFSNASRVIFEKIKRT